jgi:uracil-DNA glycosylase family 4
VTEAGRRAALEQIAEEVRACTRCRLHEGRTQAVPGEGHPSTEVLFVGEAPGLNEDRQGRPFVGAAGQLLEELLGSVGWARDQVFITNVVKCRPPQNRDPEPDEIAACAPFLRRQLDVLEPKLIVTLGRHSMGRFLPGARIGQVHGTVRDAAEGSPAEGIRVFAMYHPAAALHQGSLKGTLFEDMAAVPTALLEARSVLPEGDGTPPPSTSESTAATPMEAVAAAPDRAPTPDRPAPTTAAAAERVEGEASRSDQAPEPESPAAPTPDADPTEEVADAVAAADPAVDVVDDDQMMMFR